MHRVYITVISFNLGIFISDNMLIRAYTQPEVVTLRCYFEKKFQQLFFQHLWMAASDSL